MLASNGRTQANWQLRLDLSYRYLLFVEALLAFVMYFRQSFRAGQPFDPYKSLELFMRLLTNFSFLGAVIAVVVAVFVISALVAPVANFTTGITIAHTGFTPNPNITQSPGTVPLLQLYPFLFVVLGLIVIYRYAEAEMPRGGL